MITRDYLFRQIQQLIALLARVLFLKNTQRHQEAIEEVDNALRLIFPTHADGPLDEGALRAFCRDEDRWSGEKALALADLLAERGRLSTGDGRPWLRRALFLYEETQRQPGAMLPFDVVERVAALRAEHDAMGPATLGDIDWERWRPVDPATLVFVLLDGQILLIRKKRGLGAGKINGPGGRLEPGELPLDGAAREVREELRVIPTGLDQRGELRFQFVDGYAIHVYVFRADGLIGEPMETDEAIPIWSPIDALPFDEMWADDRLWLPPLIAGRVFQGRFLFDGDRMLDAALDLG
jgi:8-oxo-dGTP diphosphatase